MNLTKTLKKNNQYDGKYRKLTHFNVSRKLFNLLSKKRKFQFFLLFLITLLSALSEVLILTLIVPFLVLIADPEKIWDNNFIFFLNKYLKITEPQSFLVPITLLFIIAAILVGTVRLLNLNLNIKFASKVGTEISVNTFRGIIFDSYENHLNRNSSEVISSLVAHIDVTVNVIIYLLNVLTSSIISLAIILLLISLDANLAISGAFVFGFCYLFIAFFSQDKVASNSNLVAKNIRNSVLITQESLDGIRDTILNNLEIKYINNFEKIDQKIRTARAENMFLAGFPRFSIESVGLVFLGIFSLIILRSDTNNAYIISIIGGVGLGAQRLLPTMQQVYFSWTAAKAGFSSVDEVLKLLESTKNHQPRINVLRPIQFDKKIEFKNISFKYKENSNFILENINFQINKGDRIGIVGKTGSGKSTLIDILICLIKPTKGEIFIDEKEITKSKSYQNINGWRNLITHVPQNIFLLDGTIAENIAFGIDKREINYKKLKWAAEKAQLIEYINKQNDGFNTLVGEKGLRLSGGQRQRIAISRAFYKDSKILIFDEATSALDNKTENEIIKHIKSIDREITIIVIAHRLNSIKFCDKLIEIKNRKVVLHNQPQLFIDSYNQKN